MVPVDVMLVNAAAFEKLETGGISTSLLGVDARVQSSWPPTR